MARFFRRGAYFALGVGALTALGACAASAQMLGGQGLCSVTIQGAGNGGSVSQIDTVSGMASLPSDAALWIFTQVKGANLWWPQGGDSARLLGGAWTVRAYFGLPQEAGKDFRIAAVPVDEDTDVSLTMGAQRANKKNLYPGMALPRPADNCKITTVTVHRVQ